MNEIKRSKVKNFIEEVIKLCKNYNFSILYEDTHGALIISDYNEKNINWFKNALMKQHDSFLYFFITQILSPPSFIKFALVNGVESINSLKLFSL